MFGLSAEVLSFETWKAVPANKHPVDRIVGRHLVFQDDWQETGCAVRREDGRSEPAGFQFSQTIARLPRSLSTPFPSALWKPEWLAAVGVRMWVGQEVKRPLVFNLAITNRKPKPFDNASVWGLGTCRDAKIWHDSETKQWAKRSHVKKLWSIKANTHCLGEVGLREVVIKRDQGWLKEVKWNS